MLLHQLLPLGRQPRDRGFLDVIRRHLHELGLRRRAGRGPSRQDQIGQFVIRLEAARLGIERRARHAGRLRLRPQRGDELGEGGVGGAGGRTAAPAPAACQHQQHAAIECAHVSVKPVNPVDRPRSLPSMRRRRALAASVEVIRKLVDIGNADRRQNENGVDDGLPHHAGFGVAGLARRQPAGLDEGAQQMDRRDADDRPSPA